MDADQAIQAAATAASVLVFLVPSLMRMSAKFQALQSGLVGLEKHCVTIEKDLEELKAGLGEARSARASLWGELNQIRERTAKLEARSS